MSKVPPRIPVARSLPVAKPLPPPPVVEIAEVEDLGDPEPDFFVDTTAPARSVAVTAEECVNEEEVTTSTRECEHCGNTMPSSARLCPHCKTWCNKSVARSHFLVELGFCILMVAGSIIFATVYVVGQNTRRSMDSRDWDWHVASYSQADPFATCGMAIGPGTFSLEKFLTSASGWLIMSMVVAMLSSFVLIIFGACRQEACKKIKP